MPQDNKRVKRVGNIIPVLEFKDAFALLHHRKIQEHKTHIDTLMIVASNMDAHMYYYELIDFDEEMRPVDAESSS